jgi:DMSO/TMAO reductase YedYZ molybdopterin-dependent catalytic subunit
MYIALTLTACAHSEGEYIEWNLTLVGEEELVLSYDEIKALPFHEGLGGFFTTVGIVNGPYEAKGVLLEDLCDLVGGITSSDAVRVSAADGYSMVFSYHQIRGNFITYDLKTMKEVPHGELKVILMYERDGSSLSQEDGRPLRIAIVSSDELLTEGHYWVKWVDKIEILNFE